MHVFVCHHDLRVLLAFREQGLVVPSVLQCTGQAWSTETALSRCPIEEWYGEGLGAGATAVSVGQCGGGLRLSVPTLSPFPRPPECPPLLGSDPAPALCCLHAQV